MNLVRCIEAVGPGIQGCGRLPLLRQCALPTVPFAMGRESYTIISFVALRVTSG